MLKKLLSVLVISFAIFAASGIELSAKQTDCEHTYQIVVQNGVRYLYEFTCDGSIVNVTVMDD